MKKILILFFGFLLFTLNAYASSKPSYVFFYGVASDVQNPIGLEGMYFDAYPMFIKERIVKNWHGSEGFVAYVPEVVVDRNFSGAKSNGAEHFFQNEYKRLNMFPFPVNFSATSSTSDKELYDVCYDGDASGGLAPCQANDSINNNKIVCHGVAQGNLGNINSKFTDPVVTIVSERNGKFYCYNRCVLQVLKPAGVDHVIHYVASNL